MNEESESRTSNGGASGPQNTVRRENLSGSRRRSRPRADDDYNRSTLYVVRMLFAMICVAIAFYTVRVLNLTEYFVEIVAFSCALTIVVIAGELFFSKTPIRTLAGIAFGLIMGLAMSLLFGTVVEFFLKAYAPAEVEGMAEWENLLAVIQLLTTSIFCYYGVTILLRTKDDFKFIIPYVEFRKDLRRHTPLVLDTSMIIDGRVLALIDTGVLDHRLVVPRFVLNELQNIADSSDRSRRERGRRGMDVLQKLQDRHGVEVIEGDLPPGIGVDGALLVVAEELRGKLLTTDYNLQKRADLQGISVINVNDLATALKPVVVPGENLRLKLLREGDGAGQAVGFLDDGTMVVVENSSRQVGREVTVEVTSSTQTNAGKMIFGRLKKIPPRRPRRSARRIS